MHLVLQKAKLFQSFVHCGIEHNNTSGISVSHIHVGHPSDLLFTSPSAFQIPNTHPHCSFSTHLSDTTTSIFYISAQTK